MRLLARGLAALALALVAPACLAQMAPKMDALFDSMSNVTSPGIVEGQTRGVLTGGAIQARFGTAGIQIAGFSPPSISAGCGGIDAWGGSFSFVNKEQFTNFARKVAANAAGYMFKLALQSMCSACENTMSGVQSTVETVNRYFQNSCETAQLLSDKSGGAAAARAVGASARSFMRSTGIGGDEYENAHQGPGEQSEAAALANSNPDAGAKLIPGNVVYKAMREAGLGSWFGDGTGDEFYQDVMSLTGTLIVCVPGVGGCRAPEFDTSSREKEPVAFPIRGTVRFMDLVLGSRSGPLTFLRCSGECLDVTPMPVVTYKGMADRVVDVLSGTQGAYGDDGGLIGKFARNLGAFTDKERGFMTGMGAYTSKALALARRNEAAAHQFVAAFAPELGAEILANYIDRIVASSIIAVDLRGTDATGQMRQMLDEVRRGIRDDRAAIAQSISGQAQLMAYFDALLRNSEAPYVPPRAYTIPGSE